MGEQDISRYAPTWDVDLLNGQKYYVRQSGQVILSKPEATILDASSGTVTDRGQALQFGGSGFDKLGHAMVEYRWMSDKDGLLSDQANFTKTKLSYNTHAITFQVKDIEGMWSTKAKTSFTYAPNLAPKIVEPEQDVFYSDDWVATEATGEARLTFDVYAEDPEGDDITYSVGSLPNGSTFTIITDALQRKVGRFEWITTLKDFTQTVYFTAKDWQLSGSKAVYIRIR